jgi:hypothetical protein
MYLNGKFFEKYGKKRKIIKHGVVWDNNSI